MYGDLVEEGGRWRLRFTRRLRHPRERVWRALTEPEHLAAWFPTTIEGERAAGAKLRFSFADDAAPFEGEMRVWEPPSVLEFAWGEDVLRFELRQDGEDTVLTLWDTLDDVGKGARDAAGWHVCLDNLERHLDGDGPDGAGWKALNEVYRERFGPAASTIGPPEGLEPEE